MAPQWFRPNLWTSFLPPDRYTAQALNAPPDSLPSYTLNSYKMLSGGQNMPPRPTNA